MANVYAIKSGNWSDTTVWNTGALPTSVDDVYANNFNVNINENITVNSLRNTANTGISIGGTFSFNTGGVTANINDNIYFGSGTAFIIASASSGLIHLNMPFGSLMLVNIPGVNMINHTGNCNFTITCIKLYGNANGSAGYLLNKSSSGVLILNCNIVGITGTGNGVPMMYLSAGDTIVNGTVTGGYASTSSTSISVSGTANLTINGNVIGGGSTNAASAISFSSSSTLSITGSVSGNFGKAIIASNGTINITGTIIGGASTGQTAIDISGAATLNHIGTAQASAFASAIKCDTPTTSTVVCTGPFLKNGYIVAIASQTLRINFNSNSYFQFKKSNGDDIDYVSTVEGYNYPLASDVRYGVEYKSGLAIGTCHVPTPDNVRKNIPVDNTVGTSDNVNAEDILEAIQNSSLPIAERLRNVATVESTGAQIISFN